MAAQIIYVWIMIRAHYYNCGYIIFKVAVFSFWMAVKLTFISTETKIGKYNVACQGAQEKQNAKCLLLNLSAVMKPFTLGS